MTQTFNEERTKVILDRFAGKMLDRLREHADRGAWDDRPISTFQKKFLQKHLEIAEAIEAQDWEKAGMLCVDAANHYLMFADRVGSLAR